MTLCIGGSDQDHPQKCKKAKWLSEKTLQIAMKRREVKGKGEKQRYTHLNAEFQNNTLQYLAIKVSIIIIIEILLFITIDTIVWM